MALQACRTRVLVQLTRRALRGKVGAELAAVLARTMTFRVVLAAHNVVNVRGFDQEFSLRHASVVPGDLGRAVTGRLRCPLSAVVGPTTRCRSYLVDNPRLLHNSDIWSRARCRREWVTRGAA